MTNRRGNPQWGKRKQMAAVEPTVTEFEQTALKFKLEPHEYVKSVHLREWALRNRHSRYIPEPLLKAWGLKVQITL